MKRFFGLHASKRDSIGLLWLLGKPSFASGSTVLISSTVYQTGSNHARVEIQGQWHVRSHFCSVVKQLDLSLHSPPCAPYSRSIFDRSHRATREGMSVLARMQLYDTTCTLSLWCNPIQTNITSVIEIAASCAAREQHSIDTSMVILVASHAGRFALPSPGAHGLLELQRRGGRGRAGRCACARRYR